MACRGQHGACGAVSGWRSRSSVYFGVTLGGGTLFYFVVHRSLHTELLRFQKTLASEVQFPLLWHPASGAAPLRLDPIARPLPLRIGYVILPDRSCLGAEAKVNADPRSACQKARPRRAP